MVTAPRVRALAGRVLVREDKALTAMLPNVRPARVEVILKSGLTLTETVDCARGGFDNPFTEAELKAKFYQLSALALPNSSLEPLEKVIWKLPDLSDLSPISSILQNDVGCSS